MSATLTRREAAERRNWFEDREARIEAYCRRVHPYVDALERERREESHRPRLGRRKSVQCLETGEVFASLTEAGASVGRSPSNIWAACKFRIACGGLHWTRSMEMGTGKATILQEQQA